MAHPVRIKTTDGWQDIAGSGAIPVFEQAADPGASAPLGAMWVETDVDIASVYALPTPVGQDGKWLKAVGGAAVWTDAVGYGTSLPGSPTDKQEHVLVDSVTAPQWQWRLRYNAGSSQAQKWECIGATPIIVSVTAQNSISGNWPSSPTDVPGGPSLTVPFAGIYEVEWGCTVVGTTAAAHISVIRIVAGSMEATIAGAGSPGATVSFTVSKATGIACTAGQVLKLQAACVAGTIGSPPIGERYLQIRPIRVS